METDGRWLRKFGQIRKEAAIALDIGSFCFLFPSSLFYLFIVLFDPKDLPQDDKNSHNYLVFARKYRPQNFDNLIGQNHIIETFTNAFAKNRMAHAYLLTGVRGVGKTTTARILAKGFNCLNSDQPTVQPCGVCDNCQSIAQGKNMDVYEMDAASRTGINDIREIIDSLPYKPLHCRYKIFIIDEVHMLSNAAFNGLLKTLEEPPGHVKFIFATTEIQKIPATILSRCQKIELKRVEFSVLKTHFENICGFEDVTYDDMALSLIARAADGSVRDGLSILDQAVSRGGGHITAAHLSDMLGANLSDKAVEIFSLCYDYKAAELLEYWHKLHQSGVDPILFIKEFLHLLQWIIRRKHSENILTTIPLSPKAEVTAIALAKKIEFPRLSRMWDIAIKALGDGQSAPDPLAVCDIMFIRMMYGLHIPDPAALQAPLPEYHPEPPKEILPASEASEKKNTNIIDIEAASVSVHFPDLKDLLDHLKQKRALSIAKNLEMDYVIGEYAHGKIVIFVDIDVDAPNISHLSRDLFMYTNIQWDISVRETDKEKGHQTHREKALMAKKEKIEIAKELPIIQELLHSFPKAKITNIDDLN